MRGKFMRASATIAALAVSVALAACGDDEESAETASTTTTAAETTTEATETTTTDVETTTTEETTTTAAPTGDVPDQAEAEEIVIGYLIENDCDSMTEEFLHTQALFAEDNATREELCAEFSEFAIEAQYTAEDIVFSDYAVEGDEVKITVGDNFSNVESVYTLVEEDGAWRILSAEL